MGKQKNACAKTIAIFRVSFELMFTWRDSGRKMTSMKIFVYKIVILSISTFCRQAVVRVAPSITLLPVVLKSLFRWFWNVEIYYPTLWIKESISRLHLQGKVARRHIVCCLKATLCSLSFTENSNTFLEFCTWNMYTTRSKITLLKTNIVQKCTSTDNRRTDGRTRFTHPFPWPCL